MEMKLIVNFLVIVSLRKQKSTVSTFCGPKFALHTIYSITIVILIIASVFQADRNAKINQLAEHFNINLPSSHNHVL